MVQHLCSHNYSIDCCMLRINQRDMSLPDVDRLCSVRFSSVRFCHQRFACTHLLWTSARVYISTGGKSAGGSVREKKRKKRTGDKMKQKFCNSIYTLNFILSLRIVCKTELKATTVQIELTPKTNCAKLFHTHI